MLKKNGLEEILFLHPVTRHNLIKNLHFFLFFNQEPILSINIDKISNEQDSTINFYDITEIHENYSEYLNNKFTKFCASNCSFKYFRRTKALL